MSTENSTPNPSNSGSNLSHILKTLLLWGLFAAVGAAIAITIAVVIAWRQLPPIDALKDYKPRMAMQIYSADGEMIGEFGVDLEDGQSRFGLMRLSDDSRTEWQVTMSEGRNRQIRRTFAALGYTVTALHRIQFGPYSLGDIKPGECQITTMR